MASNFYITNCITIVCFVYVLIILIMFFLKGRTHRTTGKVFFALLVCTLICSILFTIWSFLASNALEHTILMGKILCFSLVCWDYLLVFYMAIVFKSDKENDDFYKKHNMISYVLGFILVLINALCCIFLKFEIETIENGRLFMLGGPLNLFMTIIGAIALLYSVITMFAYRKRLDKVTSILGISAALIALTSIITGVTEIMPMNDMCFLHTLVIMFLYLSIESQDGSLLEEFNISNLKAEESNKLKSEFIMNMSHQLRTPMNTILGFSDSLLTSEKLLQSELIDDTTNIEIASRKLFDLVNSILDISKLESNNETVNNEDYKLETIIYDISSNINALITKENLIFSINVNEDVYNYLNGDDYKLSKILNIFLSNSVKYTNYGEVSLNVSCNFIETGIYEFVFNIKNTGPGMKKENFDITFEELMKLNSQNNNDIDTDILRIIVAKDLLELIGGSVEFIKESNNNSQYIIKLKQKVLNDERIGNIREKIQTKHSLSYSKIDLSSKKCLIVDDERINTIILNRLLKQYKIQIDSVANPRDGVDKASYENYDIIFVNHDMDEMSGIDFVKKLQGTGNKVSPIVALTSVSDTLSDESVYTEHIMCPVEFRVLNKVIKKIFEDGGAQ